VGGDGGGVGAWGCLAGWVGVLSGVRDGKGGARIETAGLAGMIEASRPMHAM